MSCLFKKQCKCKSNVRLDIKFSSGKTLNLKFCSAKIGFTSHSQTHKSQNYRKKTKKKTVTKRPRNNALKMCVCFFFKCFYLTFSTLSLLLPRSWLDNFYTERKFYFVFNTIFKYILVLI